DEGNYIDVINHWAKALLLFEQIQSPSVNVARAELMRLQERIGEVPAVKHQSKVRGLIRIIGGKEAGRIYEIHNNSLRIGRSSESDIFLEELSVSRVHATLLPLGNGN